MDKARLNRAIKHLSIRDIRLDNSSVVVSENFDPLFPNAENINVQFKSGIISSEIGNFKDGNSGESGHLLRARYHCAFRVFVPDSIPDSNEGEEDAVHVTAEFIAYYIMGDDLEKDLVDEFSKYNVGYHVWPYWREYASSIASRLRLPPIIPPLYVLPSFDNEK